MHDEQEAAQEAVEEAADSAIEAAESAKDAAIAAAEIEGVPKWVSELKSEILAMRTEMKSLTSIPAAPLPESVMEVVSVEVPNLESAGNGARKRRFGRRKA